ncbi:hypothetical protein ACIBG8_05250 [Nonomuraea sp. NPDC050556]|uniref:hypothetical protein n=1 Tax=Nonomuraea sp. NPDC050556 TaxID=3364369 RepID=UPI0037ADDAE3
MMYLTAGLICVALICLVDLLLTFGVVRRLREHTKILSKQASSQPAVMLLPQERVAAFEAGVDDSGSISRESLNGPTLVGFFSPGCGACTERLPSFVALAGSHSWHRDQVLAVVMGDEASTATMRAELAEVARLVDDKHVDTMVESFGVSGFPAFCLIDESGVVLASGLDVESLSVPVAG